MSKRLSKKQKERKEEDRKRRQEARRVSETELVLRSLDLLEPFRRLPTSYREWLISLRHPRIEVVADETSGRYQQLSTIAAHLNSILDECCTSIGSSQVTIRTFFSVAVALWQQFSVVRRPTRHPTVDAFQLSVTEMIRSHILPRITYAYGDLIRFLERELLPHSRIDDTIYRILPRYGCKKDSRYVANVVIHAHDAQQTRRTIDGKARRLYRCGAPFRGGLNWVSWTSNDVPAITSELPVFVSSHAIRQFRERVTIQQHTGEVEDSMWYSLRTPHIEHSQPDNSVLVAHHFFGYKLGYFVAMILDDMVAVITYLFLTMDGTPEGEKLRDKLRLHRPDREYLELDKLNTFLLSDIHRDTELAVVLEQCGCGHLLKMIRHDVVPEMIAGKADEVRQYLGKRLRLAGAEDARENTLPNEIEWSTGESAP